MCNDYNETHAEGWVYRKWDDRENEDEEDE